MYIYTEKNIVSIIAKSNKNNPVSFIQTCNNSTRDSSKIASFNDEVWLSSTIDDLDLGHIASINDKDRLSSKHDIELP